MLPLPHPRIVFFNRIPRGPKNFLHLTFCLRERFSIGIQMAVDITNVRKAINNPPPKIFPLSIRRAIPLTIVARDNPIRIVTP